MVSGGGISGARFGFGLGFGFWFGFGSGLGPGSGLGLGGGALLVETLDGGERLVHTERGARMGTLRACVAGCRAQI